MLQKLRKTTGKQSKRGKQRSKKLRRLGLQEKQQPQAQHEDPFQL